MPDTPPSISECFSAIFKSMYDRNCECILHFSNYEQHILEEKRNDDDDAINQQPLVRLTQTRSQALS